ncbi:hypothetical protein ACQE30_01275 [Staphylococcus cohnii]|uniref:Uncharacterized protein n=2 Tax=Staphylococcus cohnii TaxID=29382 RepID=A0ABT6IWW8_9STAP|nr:hypothetical protein [Staphylococcus cohnii]TGP66060.1 hypothetical protein EN872_00490 [bacterium M00.F.Ca.ET.229.01.1.1]TGS42309.1 hypothetical protein EN823_00490 [bacterium M00.F.Ca.ET.180.01.1.1]KKI63504.1 hypothetical protein UF66_0551 [Staphylococcus cohnii subsp. cohnii]MCI2939993.1 hypothetical protein [Staphylococcus cohnii]MDE1709039.1 hypothetical protein [Staphylococcus cohnii]
MSDIIPFPRSKEKLIREIKQAFNENNFEQAYDLFESLEAQFELDEQMSLLKCAMLFKMEYYLELREEAIILLKQGMSNYDDLMIYYVQSLNGLGQYFEVVEIINQIIDEVNDHKTRMELFPIKEFALSQIDKHNEHAAQMLQNFDTLTLKEQVNIMLTLIDHSQYRYQETVIHLLNALELAPNVVSIMLEYLRFAKNAQTITIHKYGYEIDVIPRDLEGLEQTLFKTTIIPNVLKQIEDGASQLVEEALHLLNNHAILLYPLNIESIATKQTWIEGYTNYFKSMVGLEKLDETNHVLTLIVSLDKEK